MKKKIIKAWAVVSKKNLLPALQIGGFAAICDWGINQPRKFCKELNEHFGREKYKVVPVEILIPAGKKNTEKNTDRKFCRYCKRKLEGYDEPGRCLSREKCKKKSGNKKKRI